MKWVAIFASLLWLVKANDKGQLISKAHFEFSLNLYKSIEKNSDNLVLSPYTINALLSMLFLGTSSSSNSSMQLRSMMNFDQISYVDVHNQFKKIVKNFDNEYYQSKMSLKHGLYISEDVTVAPPFDRALREFYKAKIHHVDFSDQKELQEINDNFEKETEVKNILNADPKSRLVMLDAIRLSTKWLFPFDEEETYNKGLFFSPDNQRYEVPTMYGKFKLPLGYSQDMECRVLELPFEQKRISMFILLPDDPINGLNRLEANMTSENIKSLFSTLKDEVVNVKLPKFKMAAKFELTKSLKKLGLVDLVSKETADLGLMAPTDTLTLSSFTHTSTFEVSEGGATKPKSISTGSSSFGEKHFEVDHSFLFLIWDYYSGMLLLMGRVVNPLLLG